MDGGDEIQAYQMRITSPEIVEIEEDSRSGAKSRDGGTVDDVYVAVGRDDVEVVKWAIDHVVSPGARVNLVHVFSPITSIPTPVGRLSKSQLSTEQLRVHVNEENNKRRNLLQKYIRLCDDAKVPVETMLVESNAIAKAILDLIPVLNITKLIVGTKRQPSPRRFQMKGMGKGEFVKRNAPDYCEVTIFRIGKKLVDGQKVVPATAALAPNRLRPEIERRHEKSCFLGCFPFPLKSD